MTPPTMTAGPHHHHHAPHHGKAVKSSPSMEEFIKFIKVSSENAPRAPKYNAKVKVKNRTSQVYLSEKGEDAWDKKHSRRKKTMGSGFFTPSHIPYRSIGAMSTLHYKNAVMKELRGLVKSLPASREHREKAQTGKDTYHHLNLHDLDDMQEHSGNEKKIRVLKRKYQTAGFKKIKDVLKENNFRINAVKCGQPYEKHIRDVQALRIEREKAEKAPPKVLTMINLSELNLRKGRRKNRDRHLVRAHDEEHRRWLQEKKQKLMIDELKYIYLIICSLYNMKAKHLRLRKQLPLETLHILRKDPFLAENMDDQHIHALPVHQRRLNNIQQSTDTVASVTGNMSRVIGRDQARVGGSMSMSGTSSPGLAHLIRRRNVLIRDNPHPQNKDFKIETWEDLLNSDNINARVALAQRRKMSILRQITSKHPWMFRPSHMAHEPSERRPSSLPLWQQAIFADKQWRQYKLDEHLGNGEERDRNNIVTDHTPQHSGSGVNPNEAIERFEKNLLSTKKEVTEEMEAVLHKMEREKLMHFYQKYRTFGYMTPTTIYEEHKKDLQSSVERTISKHIDVLDTDTVEWFEHLKKDMMAGMPDKDPEIEDLLSRISKYAVKDLWKHIMKPREKLCLLVMSFPATEICTDPCQLAVLFVLEDILHGPSDMMAHWLHLRKLPIIKHHH